MALRRVHQCNRKLRKVNMANDIDKTEAVITSPPATCSADGHKTAAGHKAAYHLIHGSMLLMAIFGAISGAYEEDKGNIGRSLFFYAMVFAAVVMREFFECLEAECDRDNNPPNVESSDEATLDNRKQNAATTPHSLR